MTKKRKLLEKLLAGTKNIRFDEFVILLEAFGFELERIRGSHHLFAHPDIPDLMTIQPQHGGKAKPYQLRQFLSIIEEYDLTFAEDDE